MNRVFFAVFLAAQIAFAQEPEAVTNLRKAWPLTLGQKSIVVAVVDTGIDMNHPALKDALWVNPGETGRDKNGHSRENNQIDDDANGFIDDVHGWNFAGNNNDLTDHLGHGTHIAGIIAARRMAPFQFQGVAPNVKLMVLKYYDPHQHPGNNLENSTKAMKYAVQMKANIINFSSGGSEKSIDEELVIRSAGAAGILFVSAAGNEGFNNDLFGFYPATYGLDNVISVASLKVEADRLLTSSNYGKKTVDVAAPGEEIFSTLPGSTYGRMSGTSQATAYVTGIAALAMSVRSNPLTPIEIKQQILSVADRMINFNDRLKSAGRINAFTALTTLPRGQTAFGEKIDLSQSLDTELFSIRPTH
jgi:thermitase